MHVERQAAALEILELAGAVVGRTAQHEDSLVLALEEWLERLAAEVRTHRDGVCLHDVEGEAHVAAVRIVDVGALGVEDHRYAGRDAVSRPDAVTQPHEASDAVRFVEGTVELEGASDVTSCLDDGLVEG